MGYSPQVAKSQTRLGGQPESISHTDGINVSFVFSTLLLNDNNPPEGLPETLWVSQRG